MKVGILGAGISGLSAAKLLSKHFDVEILEAQSTSGGIAKTKEVDGIAYHTVGGHCFNSKYKDVLDFVFDQVLAKKHWHLVNRKAIIKLKNNKIPYPIEYSVKQIAEFDPNLALAITSDFLNTAPTTTFNNLEDWFRKKFGNTLSEIYFLPYNRKIWDMNPLLMSPQWVEGKLPVPDKQSFFKGLISNETDKMPHAKFYYPKSNNQNTFIECLSKDINITYKYSVEKIFFDQRVFKWIINEDKKYDVLISTLPLNLLPSLIKPIPEYLLEQAKKLRYNKVSTMLWTTKETDNTWTYIPDKESIFHRYIHIGNYFNPNSNFTITEAIGERSFEEMLQEGRKDSFLIDSLDYHVSDHAYVVFDANYQTSTEILKTYMKSINLHLLGRFGEWDYLNMDECIKRSINLSQSIITHHSNARL